MPCPCKDKAAPAAAPPSSHEPGLACERCIEGHLGYAAVLAAEVAEDASRIVERRLCLGNLKAAEQHARALGRDALRATIREARHAFAAGDPAPVLALLSVPLSNPGEF
jgi:hypothetical protein